MLATMTPGTVHLAVSEILDKKGWSTAQFAEKAGITYATALAIRRGNYARIGLDTIARLCEALGVEPGELIVFEKKDSVD
jgi:putative transcriptional regulator